MADNAEIIKFLQEPIEGVGQDFFDAIQGLELVFGRGRAEKQDFHEGEWGWLSAPCRFCRKIGVFFMIDDGLIGMAGDTTMRCDKCRRTWQADSVNA